MNSIVLSRSGLPGISLVKTRHAFPNKPFQRKSLVSGGLGLVLSMAFYWMLLNKTVSTTESPKIPASPNQAVYQWKGFCRVGLDAR